MSFHFSQRLSRLAQSLFLNTRVEELLTSPVADRKYRTWTGILILLLLAISFSHSLEAVETGPCDPAIIPDTWNGGFTECTAPVVDYWFRQGWDNHPSDVPLFYSPSELLDYYNNSYQQYIDQCLADLELSDSYNVSCTLQTLSDPQP